MGVPIGAIGVPGENGDPGAGAVGYCAAVASKRVAKTAAEIVVRIIFTRFVVVVVVVVRKMW